MSKKLASVGSLVFPLLLTIGVITVAYLNPEAPPCSDAPKTRNASPWLDPNTRLPCVPR